MRDLAIEIDPAFGRQDGLERALRDAIGSGRLAAGSTMPSTRALASDLGLSRATVVAAYQQLQTEGYLRAQQGSGTVVARLTTPSTEARDVGPAFPSYPSDFRPGEPDASTFPRQRWHRSAGRVLAEATDDLLGYPDPRGLFPLRSALSEYLARARGVVASADSVNINSGFGPGLGLLGDLFLSRGIGHVGIEDPTMPFTHGYLSSSGVKTVPIPVDDEGIDVAQVAACGVGAVVVTPAHQYPLGCAMSGDRREALIEWARSTGGWIVEDDYDGEFCYDRRPSGALQAAAPDRVIYAGTASKSLIPGLRLSWLVVPSELRSDFERIKYRRGAMTSAFEQLTLADFIGQGELDRHLRTARPMYRKRKQAMVDSLVHLLPDLRSFTDFAGLHLTVGLPAGVDVPALVRDAHNAGIGLMSLDSHCLRVDPDPGLILGFSRPASHQYDWALDQLSGFLEAHLT